MVRRLGLGKNNHLTYASLALNPRCGFIIVLMTLSSNLGFVNGFTFNFGHVDDLSYIFCHVNDLSFNFGLVNNFII